MAFITSLLALAAIFVVLATLTTAFVETMHGLLQKRVKGLEKLVEAMYDDLFENEKKQLPKPGAQPNPNGWLRFKAALQKWKVQAQDLVQFRATFVDDMIKNQVAPDKKWIEAIFDALVEKVKAAQVPPEDQVRKMFVEAMTRNPVAPDELNPLQKLTVKIGMSSPNKFDWLDLRRFIQQLAKTKIGEVLAGAGNVTGMIHGCVAKLPDQTPLLEKLIDVRAKLTALPALQQSLVEIEGKLKEARETAKTGLTAIGNSVGFDTETLKKSLEKLAAEHGQSQTALRQQIVDIGAKLDPKKLDAKLADELSGKLDEIAGLVDNDATALETGITKIDVMEAALKQRLKEIAANFERYAEGMSALFQRRAGIYAGLAGVGLAAFMNIDGALLADRLFNDSGLAKQVVVSLPGDKLQELIDKQKALQEQCQGPGADTDKCKELAKTTLEAGQADLEGLGLPIGKTYFPYCEGATPEASAKSDERCATVAKTRDAALLFAKNEEFEKACTAGNEDDKKNCREAEGKKYLEKVKADGQGASTLADVFANGWGNKELALSWLLSILVTGALIGLGAPFWFDIYKKIASFAPLTGAAGEAGKAIAMKKDQGAAAPQTPAPAPEKAKALTPEELLEIFKLARAK